MLYQAKHLALPKHCLSATQARPQEWVLVFPALCLASSLVSRSAPKSFALYTMEHLSNTQAPALLSFPYCSCPLWPEFSSVYVYTDTSMGDSTAYAKEGQWPDRGVTLVTSVTVRTQGQPNRESTKVTQGNSPR